MSAGFFIVGRVNGLKPFTKSVCIVIIYIYAKSAAKKWKKTLRQF